MAEAPKENASTFIASLQENFLQCIICMEQFTDPRVLDCLHSYCFKCIKQHVGNVKIIKCPICNQEMHVPKEGTSGIKSNFFIKGIIQQLDTAVSKEESAKKTCTACNSGLLTIGHCDGCQNDICSNCDELHKQINILKKHNITYFDNHENKVENTVKDDKTKEYLEKIKLQMNVMDAQKQNLDHSVSSLTKRIDKIEQEGADTIKAIESSKQQFIDVIESYTDELKETVRKNIQLRLGNLKVVLNMAKFNLFKLTKLKADTYSQLKEKETMLCHLDKKDEKEIYQQLLSKLIQLQEQIAPLPNAPMPNVPQTTFVKGINGDSITLPSCHQIIGFLLPQKSRTERSVSFFCNKMVPNHMQDYAIHCAHSAVDNYGMEPRNVNTYNSMSTTISNMYTDRYQQNTWFAVTSQPEKGGWCMSNCGTIMLVKIDHEDFTLIEILD